MAYYWMKSISMKMRKNYGQDLCGKNKSYHKPFRVLSETVGIFMESERRQRTGTETCKDCDQQEQTLQISVTTRGRQSWTVSLQEWNLNRSRIQDITGKLL